MSRVRHAINSVIVALFALAFIHAPWLIHHANPIMSRVLGTGVPAGPNVLLTVSGRASGQPRSVPVSIWRLADRSYVQAASTDTGWVVGPTTRPPIGILHAFRLRVDTTLAEYVAYARRHPVFELRAHS